MVAELEAGAASALVHAGAGKSAGRAAKPVDGRSAEVSSAACSVLWACCEAGGVVCAAKRGLPDAGVASMASSSLPSGTLGGRFSQSYGAGYECPACYYLLSGSFGLKKLAE